MTDPLTENQKIAPITGDTRALAAALEAALNWCYARDMLTHIKIGVPEKSNFCAEYQRDIRAIQCGVRLGRKLGFAFKVLETP